MENTTTTSQGTTLETVVETLETFKRSQVVFPLWMEEATAGLADSDLVEVTRENAGFFGRFVRSVNAA